LESDLLEIKASFKGEGVLAYYLFLSSPIIANTLQTQIIDYGKNSGNDCVAMDNR
tara:strand:+ start:269 stop:433 length:165 start_codon:yes stop_codon:yes gene_type:complete